MEIDWIKLLDCVVTAGLFGIILWDIVKIKDLERDNIDLIKENTKQHIIIRTLLGVMEEHGIAAQVKCYESTSASKAESEGLTPSTCDCKCKESAIWNKLKGE